MAIKICALLLAVSFTSGLCVLPVRAEGIDSVTAVSRGVCAVSNETCGVSEQKDNRREGVTSPVNINSAGIEQLKSLPGIGEVIAERIIAYRQTNSFGHIEDIKLIKGIGDKNH